MSSPETEKVECLIIGSGPAGYTAAIYAARADLKPVVYTGLQMGGQLTTTTEVDNFPGYPQGVTGPVMMEDLQKQAERFGTDIRFGIIEKVDFTQYPLKAVTDSGKIIEASTVIISTGATARWLGLESEKTYNGHGVSACATCDGFFFRGMDIAVVGGGDTACEEASYLAKLGRKVYLIVRRDELRASKAMQHRVMNTPNTDIYKGQVDLDDQGYIKTVPGSTRTNIPGVFAAGDVQDHVYRQAVTAAGTGCMAAIEAERWLGAKE